MSSTVSAFLGIGGGFGRGTKDLYSLCGFEDLSIFESLGGGALRAKRAVEVMRRHWERMKLAGPLADAIMSALRLGML